MKTVFKYPFKTEESFTLEMPVGAEILTVQTQHESPCIWALVDPAAPTVEREFVVVGTGHALQNHQARKYLGTYQVHGGIYIFHLFEKVA